MSTIDPAKVDLVSVVERSHAILKRNLLPFMALAIILIGIPQFLVNRLASNVAMEATRGTVSIATTYNIASFPILFADIAAVLLSFVYYGALTYGVFQDLRGTRVSIGEIIGHGFTTILPVAGVGIIAGIMIVIGLLLFIVPGIILGLMWVAAVPVAAVERPGIFASLRRSAALTKGQRGRIFGLFCLYTVILFVAVIVLFDPPLSTIPALLVNAAKPPASALLTGFLIVPALIISIMSAYYAVLFTVLYSELRRIKDGVGATDVAEVFT